MSKAEARSITRRSFIAALALPAMAPDFAAASSGLPASSALSVPSAPDPIYAAIEAHGRACAELEAFADTLAEAEQVAWHAPRGKRRAANKRLKEAEAAQGRLCHALTEATERFAATVPDTLAGAAAALAYVREHHAHGDPMCEEEEFVALIASTESAIRRAAFLPFPLPASAGRGCRRPKV